MMQLKTLKDNIPEFDSGDTVTVDVKVREGNKSAFRGLRSCYGKA